MQATPCLKCGYLLSLASETIPLAAARQGKVESQSRGTSFSPSAACRGESGISGIYQWRNSHRDF